MWIESIYLRNIKSFVEAKLTFSKGINIIIGNNNSGKSTIIRTIDRLQGKSHNAEGLVRNGELAGFAIMTFRGDDGFIYFRKIQRSEIGPILKKEGPDSFPVLLFANKEKHFLAQIDDYKEADKSFEELTYLRVDENGKIRHDNLDDMWPFPDEEPNNVFFASYGRRGYYDSNINDENSHQIRQDQGNLTARLQKLSNGNHPAHSAFNDATRKILGFVPSPVGLGKHSGTNLSIGIYTDNIQTVNINHMGQGVGQVLGLLSILYTQQNKIILLEEIENDLHPKALKQLLDIIAEKSKTNQFIISTHSNIVLKHLGSLTDTKIFQTSWRMKKQGEQNLPFSEVKEIANDPESRLRVLTQMGYDVTDFELWQAYLLFEESTAELIIGKFIIPNFAPSLITKVRTVASQGVDDVAPKLHNFLSLFVFIHLSGIYKHKAWVMVDGDAAGRKTIAELRKRYSDWNDDHFVQLQKDDFELYYPERFAGEVQRVLQMPKGKPKQQAKVDLRNKVLLWATENPKEAKAEFSHSAREVIDAVKRIEKALEGIKT